MKEFLKDEKGQAALEYILTVGMIIMAVVVMFVIYKKVAEASAGEMNKTSDSTSSVMSSKISAEVAKIS
jgi:Flp pilus assembly pilin Flp